MSALKKLLGQTAVYGLSSILGRVINYLLVPLYTHLFLPSAYGIITEWYAYVAFLNVVYTFGLETTFFRFSTRDASQANTFFAQTFSLMSLIALFFTLGITLSYGSINELLHYEKSSPFLGLVLVILLTDALAAIPFGWLRLKNLSYWFAGLKLLYVASNVALNLLFLVVAPAFFQKLFGVANGNTVALVFWANIISNVGVLAVLFWQTKPKWIFPTIDSTKALVLYAYPIMLAGLAGMVNEVLDRILLKAWLPNGFYEGHDTLWAVGVYGACYKLSIFMSLAIQSYKYAAEPFFFSQAQDKNAPQTYATTMRWFIILCTLMFLVLSLKLDWLQLLLVNPEYRQGVEIVPILLLANLFLGIYFNLSIWYKVADKTYWGTVFSAGGAILTLGLNYVLIPELGYTGAAWTTLICYFSMAVGSYVVGQKYFPVPYDLHSAFVHLGLASAIVYTFIEIPKLNEEYGLLIQLGILIHYLALVLWIDGLWKPIWAVFRKVVFKSR